MTCYTLYGRNNEPVGHLCGDFGPLCPCGSGTPFELLCDFPKIGGGTCSAPICPHCSVHVSWDTDYCRTHDLSNIRSIRR